MRFAFLSLLLCGPALLLHAQELRLADLPYGTRSTFDGVYTGTQAKRGNQLYLENCARCHRPDMNAYGGVLKGAYFRETWRDEPISKFFRQVKRTMPRDAKGSLRDDEYIDIVAYLLQVNEMPAGPRELTSIDLERVRVAGKEGIYAILPFGSLVEVVGCLVEKSANQWQIERGSNAFRVEDPYNSDAAQLKQDNTRPLGAKTFSLPDVSFYHPERERGQKVEAKGFLTVAPEGGKINVTALQGLGDGCGN